MWNDYDDRVYQEAKKLRTSPSSIPDVCFDKHTEIAELLHSAKQLLAKNQERRDADAARKRESRRLVKEMPAMAKPLSNLECQERLAKYDAFFAEVRALYDDDEVLRTDEDLFTRIKASVENELVVLNLPGTIDDGYIQNIVSILVSSDIVRRTRKKQ
jgi:hypothetical protein